MTNDVKNVPGLRFPGFEDVWKEKNLGRVLDIKSGKAYKENEYTIKGVPLLQGENINHNKLKKPTVFLPDSYLNDNKNTILEKDDIVVGLNRPIIKNQLKIAKVSNEFIPGILYQRSGKIIYDKSKPDFYLNFFDKQIKEFVLKESVGSDQPFISTIQLKKKRVYIPVNENEIVLLNHFFSKLDRQIELEEQKLAKLEEQKKGYMQKIFSQELRFKDEKGNDYPEWKTKKLDELGEFNSGVGFPEKYQGGNTGVPFFKVSDMNLLGNEKFMNTANNYVSIEQIKQKKWKVIQSVPAIIFAKVGAAIMLNRKRMILNPFLIDNNTMSYSFFNHWDTNFGYVVFQMLNLPKYAQVGALPSYNSKDIGIIQIRLPIKEEQEKIGDFFSKLDEHIDKQSQKIDRLKLRKQGFLQKMFI